MLNLFTENSEERQEFVLTLDEIAREVARRMLIQALNAEVTDYIAGNTKFKDDNDRRPGLKFTSKILPPYEKITES